MHNFTGEDKTCFSFFGLGFLAIVIVPETVETEAYDTESIHGPSKKVPERHRAVQQIGQPFNNEFSCFSDCWDRLEKLFPQA